MARILIAEDYDDLRQMLSELLLEMGHQVEAYADGAAAMEALCLREFDLLVLDWELPALTGLEVCKRLRQRGGETPILMLTARKTVSEKEQGFDAGADDYLTKPFHPNELKARIRALLKRSEKKLKLLDDYGELKEGTIFAERYQIVSTLGRGSTGIIYLAVQTFLNRRVALKVLHPQLLREPESVARFSREAQAVSCLSHPNIVGIHDFGITSGALPFLVMDLADGPTLGERIRNAGPLHPRKAVRLFIQACDALAHAHSLGIIHRDVKPNNMLLVWNKTDEEDLKIVDFGIAKVPAGAESLQITQNGDVLGSPLFMSPEQCMGGQLDERTDIYSLGCVMYAALTGVEPFVGENVLETMYKRTVETAKPLSEANPHLDLPPELERIVLKALSQSLEGRYQTMGQLRQDLEQVAYALA